MSVAIVLLNLLFAILAFFLTRYVGDMIMPDSADKAKLISVIALVVAVVVFLLDFASKLGVAK